MNVLSFPRIHLPRSASAGLARLRWNWRNRRPVQAFFFDRPVVVLQSDDWGRVGVRDKSGLQELREAGLKLGQNSYDLYSLETAEDVQSVTAMLRKHKDSAGRTACLQMNFVSANLDFRKMEAGGFTGLHWKPLSQGLPGKWRRPGLMNAYREGMADGVLAAGFHGMTHCCAGALASRLQVENSQGTLLRTLLRAQTPYIHSRMPWVGYEYWDRTASAWGEFVGDAEQAIGVRRGLQQLTELFGSSPVTACAPGYRANAATHAAWRENGIRVAQSGPGSLLAPHLAGGEMLHLGRGLEIEPVTSPQVTLQYSIHRAQQLLEAGLPAVVSIHSINFQSKLANYRDYTLTHVDQFLTALERRFPRLLYLDAARLWDLVTTGAVEGVQGKLRVGVRQQRAPGYAFQAGLGWPAQDWPESA